MEWSEGRSVLNQTVHIHTGNKKGEGRVKWRSVVNQPVHIRTGNQKVRWNGQRGSQCSINQFTYFLEMRKQDGMVRGAVSAQSTSSHTAWKRENKMEWSEGRAVLNQPVHILPANEKARWNG